jgi:choline kinase
VKAVILAAGQGIRLRPLTSHLPKCLVQINGKSILQYQLEALDSVGIRNCVVVVGFMAQQVQEYFGSKFANIDLTYVLNECFKETNNLYSLWLAKQHLRNNTILIEGDILFDRLLLEDIGRSQHPNVAVVDKFRSHMDGTVVLPKEGFVDSMILKSQQSMDFNYQTALKTVNIYVLNRVPLRDFLIPALDSWVALGFRDQFYESTIAQIISQGNLRLAIHCTGIRRWMEIDTVEDVQRAEAWIRLSTEVIKPYSTNTLKT